MVLSVGLAVALSGSGCTRPRVPARPSDSGAQPVTTSGSNQVAADGSATAAADEPTSTPAETPSAIPVKTKSVGLHTPAAGSSERKAILNALRVPVERQLKQSVVFKVQRLTVDRGWAFALGQPIRPNGKPVDYKKTPYARALKDGFFDDSFSALLHSSGGSWRVATYNIGATDVEWVDWDTKYGAPPAIFPVH